MSLSFARRAQALAIGTAGYPLVRALGRTWRWRVDGGARYDELMHAGRPPILALWHGRILPATVYWRDRGIVAMTSQNFDGEWIARLMGQFGFRAARGSTSRGGSRALVQMRRELAAGHAVAFTVDGPRGPACVAQPGAVWLAAATGHPVLPFHIETDRGWRTRSWDRGVVPKPFSTVAIAIGEPLQANGTADGEIETARRDLESRLASLATSCASMLPGGRLQ